MFKKWGRDLMEGALSAPSLVDFHTTWKETNRADMGYLEELKHYKGGIVFLVHYIRKNGNGNSEIEQIAVVEQIAAVEQIEHLLAAEQMYEDETEHEEAEEDDVAAPVIFRDFAKANAFRNLLWGVRLAGGLRSQV